MKICDQKVTKLCRQKIKQICDKKVTKLCSKNTTTQNTQILVFWGIPKISITFFFCHFWFPIKTIFFFLYEFTFVFPKKFIDLYHQYSQNYGPFGMGWETTVFHPPPEMKFPILSNIVVKRNNICFLLKVRNKKWLSGTKISFFFENSKINHVTTWKSSDLQQTPHPPKDSHFAHSKNPYWGEPYVKIPGTGISKLFYCRVWSLFGDNFFL